MGNFLFRIAIFSLKSTTETKTSSNFFAPFAVFIRAYFAFLSVNELESNFIKEQTPKNRTEKMSSLGSCTLEKYLKTR